jgi:hypothetical protein
MPSASPSTAPTATTAPTLMRTSVCRLHQWARDSAEPFNAGAASFRCGGPTGFGLLLVVRTGARRPSAGGCPQPAPVVKEQRPPAPSAVRPAEQFAMRTSSHSTRPAPARGLHGHAPPRRSGALERAALAHCATRSSATAKPGAGPECMETSSQRAAAAWHESSCEARRDRAAPGTRLRKRRSSSSVPLRLRTCRGRAYASRPLRRAVSRFC